MWWQFPLFKYYAQCNPLVEYYVYWSIEPFYVNVPFLYPFKTSRVLEISWSFYRYKKGTLAWNEVRLRFHEQYTQTIFLLKSLEI